MTLKINKLRLHSSLTLLVLLTFLYSHAQTGKQGIYDMLTCGSPASEKQHGFGSSSSEVIVGGLGVPARKLLAPATASWTGGRMSFKLKVDPGLQNYLTLKFWGSDNSTNRLYLVCEGKQIGYRHLGDIDILDVGSDAPLYNDRFFYNSSPLPLSLTKGKTELTMEIRAQGPIWGYGENWERYQKNMTEPSRGIYGAYTHTQLAFVPPADEKQGKAPENAVRKSPGADVLDRLRSRINNEIINLLAATKPLGQMQLQFLAKAYHEKWSAGYRNPKLTERVLTSLDALYAAWLANPRLAEGDPATWNPDWFGLGPSGQVIYLMQEPLKDKFDAPVSPSSAISRRAAFTEMLVACRDWHRQHRRLYTNQSMINDLYGIYYANKGVAALTPASALPEKKALTYLYESIGIQPWLGSESADGKPSLSAGENYMQLTRKGLTKELGFVGNYGEVLDWVAEIYEATRPQPGTPGDAKTRQQLVNVALARAPFRYPMQDDDGFKAMRGETVVGWRDTHYPGDITYGQRPSWDGGPLQVAAITLDNRLVGFAQQMLADNQFFNVIEKQMKDKGFRVTSGLLVVPGQYETIAAQPKSNVRLPMSWEEPNYLFSDEEDGVVAVKNGNEILYASLYWRARYGINNLARVHYLTPQYNNISTVAVKEEFEPSGMFYTRPDWTNLGFGNGGITYPDSLHSAHTGEKLPIAKIPAGTPFKPGNENPYAGRAQYYELEYGSYLIGMNATADKEFTLTVPASFSKATDLATGKPIGSARSITVKPFTTVVLHKN